MKTVVLAVVLSTAALLLGPSQASALPVSGGNVPIPGKIVNGSAKSTWDGSYAQLLAADALTLCWMTQPDRGRTAMSDEEDGLITGLLAYMSSANCNKTCSNPAYSGYSIGSEDKTICQWLESRTDPACNLDAATGQPRALDVKLRAPRPSPEPYGLPVFPALGFGMATADAIGGASAARNMAQWHLAYADLSLCMAEQLHEKLDTVQVAFATSDDLLWLQDAVRERALTATYEYAIITKALGENRWTSWGAVTPTVLNSPYGGAYWLAAFFRWVESGALGTAAAPSTIATELGQDFATAIGLLIEATDAAIDQRMRTSAAQNSFGAPVYDGLDGSFVRLTGPRQEILSILYGQAEGPPDVRAVLTDMSAARVPVLLGLARWANALRFDIAGVNVNRDSSAQALLLTVENAIRRADCTRDNVSPCPLATSTTSMNDYAVFQRYGVELGDAKTLVSALAELVFGPPSSSTRDAAVLSYPDNLGSTSLFRTATAGPHGPAERLTMHLLGANSFTGDREAASPVGSIVLDPNFGVQSLRASDIQAMRGFSYWLPAMFLDPTGSGTMQVGNFRRNGATYGNAGSYPNVRQLGSSTVLAIAREALLVNGAESTTGAVGIYRAASPALALIEKAIGSRQAIIRQPLATGTADTASCPGCHDLVYASVDASGKQSTDVAILTRASDPYLAFSVRNGVEGAASLAIHSTTTTVWGTSRTSVEGEYEGNSWGWPCTDVTVGYPRVTLSDSGYELRSTYGPRGLCQWDPLAAGAGVTVLLRAGSGATAQYEHVYTGKPTGHNGSYRGTKGNVVTFGGYFAQKLEESLAADEGNWAVPKYDGFGLPHDWRPAMDASLALDPGVSVEQHFLSRAEMAAQESTAAIQQTFDNLQQQALDDVALANADTQAQRLTDINYRDLCGPAPASVCGADTSQVSISIPGCTSVCGDISGLLGKMLGTPVTFPLATPVAAALNRGTPRPSFKEYEGGVLQGLYVDQWNAWKNLSSVVADAVGTAQAAQAQITAAGSEQAAAVAEYDAVKAEIKAAGDTLIANAQTSQAQTLAQLRGQLRAYCDGILQYEAQVSAATATAGMAAEDATLLPSACAGMPVPPQAQATSVCSDSARQQALDSGWSYSGPNIQLKREPVAGIQYDAKSFSYGPAIAQIDRCNQAKDAANLAIQTAAIQRDALEHQIEAVQTQIDLSVLPTYQGEPKKLAAAQARREAAASRVIAARAAAAAQELTSLQAAQTALGQFLQTGASIARAFEQSGLSAARIKLDQALSTSDLKTKFGLRSRYHSYDLFRARALTENARRLAVAARRAIESRYVVDLSRMSATEPFVDAPTLWADEIYSSDVKPPVAIGLTKSPATASGVYANKIQDYVSNLRLFVDGYAVRRPSAVVRTDAEVIQVPGPAAQVTGSQQEADFAYIDPGSTGWSFYCANSGTWIADPNVATFYKSSTPTYTLSTACNGRAPTLARYGFNLDPWGRLNRSALNAPMDRRYNVRFGLIALNAVGSGIRDCQKSADPNTCYSEPFIRYDLKHVGPTWVTDYSQVWHSQALPVAFVEGGKALATEEWLDPVANGFNRSDVTNVARMELHGRPVGGFYELTVELSPDIRVERLERLQMLVQTQYWVQQQ